MESKVSQVSHGRIEQLLHDRHLEDLEAEKEDIYPYRDNSESRPHHLQPAEWGFQYVFPSTGPRRNKARGR